MRFVFPEIIAAVLALATFSFNADGANDNDEVKFRPRKSAPEKRLEAKPYQPSKQTAVKNYSGKTFEPAKRIAAPQPKIFQAKPYENRPAANRDDDLPVYVGKNDGQGKDFVPNEKKTTVRSIPADPRNQPEEKKPYVVKNSDVEDKKYEAKADNDKRGKNPLLKPRQGIKEPESDGK
ncbi:MAG: hypothetical protein IJU44_01740 [Kiritimatiellae bacterium]|nr:hypothetical protein [Kiritimatiellia bacterium]